MALSSKHSGRNRHRQFVIALSMLFSLNQQSPRTCLIFSKSPGQAKICGYLLLGGESVARGLDLVPPGDKTDSRGQERIARSPIWKPCPGPGPGPPLQLQYQSQYERLGDCIVVATGICITKVLKR